MKTTKIAPPGARRRNTTRLAALAASVSLAAIASPAFAQCVEGPPANFTCSGQTVVSQVIVVDDATVTANPGFEVDTSGNGNGFALDVSGDGLISYQGGEAFTGAGLRFVTTGNSGLSAGGLSIFSNADIFANGTRALTLENNGSGETQVSWIDTISNIGGDGVYASSALGAGELSMIVKDVDARDDGIRIAYAGNGSATLTTLGPVVGQNGAGVRIVAGDFSDTVDLTVGDVTGGTFGVIIDSTGTGVVKVDASGTVTGLSTDGIRVSAGADTLGIDIRTAQVNGADSGITASNLGNGNLSVVATGMVAGANGDGIFASSQGAAGNIAITATDVIGDSGIRTYNSGAGTTTIVATGKVSGFGTDGINVLADIAATDVLVDAHDVEAANLGIRVENLGSGDTVVRASGTVNSVSTGISISTTAASQSAVIEAVDVISDTSAIGITHEGVGVAQVNATGNIVGAIGTGIGVNAGKGSTDVRVNAVNVSGETFGIRTLNEGTGETFIAVTGLVVATGSSPYGYGILAQNREGTTTDLFVRAAEVQASRHGILAESDGSGTMTVIADKVTSQTEAAVRVYAEGGVSAVDLAIGDATGATRGIEVFNKGIGSVNVASSGIVTGLSDIGIFVDGDVGSTGIEVHANQVSGDVAGIQTVNNGTRNTAITANAVNSASGIGIVATHGATANAISITAGEVTGSYGIFAINAGTGSTSVTSTGKVAGLTADGIRLANGSTATNMLVDVNDVESNEIAINLANGGTGVTRVRASGTVAGVVGSGIEIETGTAAQDVTVDAAAVAGTSGILVTNFGVGSTGITATGTVNGTAVDGFGIGVVSGTGTTDVRVAAVGVTGGARGISTVNDGSGETFIAATGLVSGGEFGVIAQNGPGATDLTVHTASVTGGDDGIRAENLGSGTTTVLAAGTTTGTSAVGIRALAGATAGDLTIEAGIVSGGTIGVRAQNDGIGAASITATGLVTGSNFGIYARTEFSSTDLTIRAATVQSGSYGIAANNLGTGSTTVIATGDVVGANETGISVGAGAATGDLTVLAARVSGGLSGVRVDNEGVGATAIRTTGLVTGADFGILAENDESTADLTIRATDVQAGGNAITAENLGTGKTSIVTTGSVVAQNQAGIRAFAGATSGDITVEAASASGGTSGISAVNFGLGDTRITVSGTVQGGTRGIEAFSDGNQNIAILNNGTIRNSSGLSSARAISASGGSVGIGNAGTLLGTVEIAGDSSLLLNGGSWRSTGGTSNFATIDDQLLNSVSGTIVGGVVAGTAETTVWQGLDRFRNDGVLRLQDGGIGDVVQTSAATNFTNGSVLAVDIAGLTGADSFRTTGKVQIDAGSRLQVAITQPLVLHGKYVVVQADGGLTGQFLFEDQLVTAFAGVRDGYTATTAFIEFAQMKAFAAAGLTPNQKETGAGADSLPDGNALKDALLLLPTDSAAQDAFDQLSGEIHPSGRNAMVEDSRLMRGAVLDRLVDAGDGALWGRLFGTSGISDGDYNAAELDRDTKGGVIGLDRSFGVVTVGVAGGWSDTDLRVARRNSSGSIKSVHGLVYAGARFGGFGLRGGAGYARTSTETTRRIAFQGFSATTTADYHGSVLQGFVETGYRLPVGGGNVEPFASLSAIRAKTDAFTEASGPAALTGAAISETTMSAMTGVRFETSPAGAFSLRGTVGWRHALGDLDPVGRHAFAGGTPFTVLGTAGSKDAGALNVEARYRLSPNVTLSVGYDGVLGAGNADHAITGAFKIVF